MIEDNHVVLAHCYATRKNSKLNDVCKSVVERDISVTYFFSRL